eukprot:scaffold162667_cov63-Attheya_sp.AAC.1
MQPKPGSLFQCDDAHWGGSRDRRHIQYSGTVPTLQWRLVQGGAGGGTCHPDSYRIWVATSSLEEFKHGYNVTPWAQASGNHADVVISKVGHHVVPVNAQVEGGTITWAGFGVLAVGDGPTMLRLMAHAWSLFMEHFLGGSHYRGGHGNILEGVEEAILTIVVQVGLGDLAITIKIVITENVKPFLALAAAPQTALSAEQAANAHKTGHANPAGIGTSQTSTIFIGSEHIFYHKLMRESDLKGPCA